MISKPIGTEALRAALTFIDANDRDTWIRCGMALKNELGDGGFDIFETWSRSAENFDAKAARAVWRGFKPGGGVTIATLIAEAKKGGFDPKHYAPAAPPSAADREREKQERAERERLAAAEIAATHEAVATDATGIWAKASLTGKSPYLARKKVDAYGVRYAGNDLIVPLIDVGGKLWNVQRIFSNGRKLFLKDGRVSGCFHGLGSVHTSAQEVPEWILIAEGYATGATLHQATGYRVAVAFQANNLKHAAQAVRKLYPLAKLLICGDHDAVTEAKSGKNPGVQAAMAAAKAVGGYWCKPLDLPSGCTDFNDLAGISGIERVSAQIAAAIGAVDAPATAIAPAEASGQGAGMGNAKKTRQRANTPAGGEGGGGQSTKPYFNVDDRGVWYHGFSPQGDALPPMWICSPLHVTAKSRDAVNGEWGYLLEFKDSDGQPKRWAMPASMLAGDGTQYRSTLLGLGLQIAPGLQAKNFLTVYIQTRRVDVRVRCTDRTGWHGDVFVLPDRTIGEGDELVMFQSSGGVVSQHRQCGTLDQWRDEVSMLCSGNSRLVFCISAAFAAPLLHHSGVPSGGFHLFGDSSSGKSSAFKVAGSVYGGKDYPRSWRMTDNALETVAAQHSDSLLLLDEIAQVDPKVVGDITYMLSNEQGKGRATQAATARKVSTWRTLFISNGEVSASNHMAEAGKGTRGGHDVRMAHIAADAGKGFGIFENLHDFAGGAALSDHLVKMAHQHYGAAGMAFIEWAVARASKLPDALRSRIAKLTHELCPAESHGQVSRVAARFALVGVAGEAATEAGITGWVPGEALAAMRTCFTAWLDGRGGAGNSEHQSIIRQVSGFFQMHGDARFTWWHRALDDRKPNTINRAGFKRMLTEAGTPINSNSDHGKEFGDLIHPHDAENCELEYFVLPEVFRTEICKGLSPKAVTHLLIERGLLIPAGSGDGGRADRKERLPGIGLTRCYRFSPKIATAEA